MFLFVTALITGFDFTIITLLSPIKHSSICSHVSEAIVGVSLTILAVMKPCYP